MNRLSEHLFWLEDTCSVYGVRAGGRTLLIDCGTDLRTRDVGAVDRVLLTHFHPFLLMHTGGTPAVFAYGAELTAELERGFLTPDSCGDKNVPAPEGD